MQSHNQIRYETNLVKIRELINLSLAPVSNTPILDGDFTEFMNLVCQNPDLESVLSNLNPDNIIRGFFPSAQLSQKTVECLKKCTVVIRSKEGVFQYPHQRGQRTRHELRVSFLGLYLLAYYDVNLRIFSVPNVEDGLNNIGYWGRIADEVEARCTQDMGVQSTYVNSSIDIIPPQDNDLSSILEDVSQIYALANKFELNTLRYELLPKRQKNFKGLEASINRAIIAMPMSIVEVVDHIINHSYKPHERDQEDLRELIANTFPEACLSNNFIQQENNSVKLSLDAIQMSDHEAKDYAIFYTTFFFMMLYAFAKNNDGMIAHKAQSTPYKGKTELFSNHENFEQWLCGILAANDIQLDTLFDNSLQRLGNVILQHGTYLWTLLHRSFSIPNSIFKEILQSKAFLLVKKGMEEIALFREKEEEMNFYKQMPTVELVRFILDDATEPHPHKSAYIRKLSPGEDNDITHRYLAKEFNQNIDKSIVDFQKIRPATKIIPGIPVQTYQGNWENASGIVILTPPDDSIPMVGYKRPAHSHSLMEDNIDHALGFPYSTEEILRNQGGKPSFSNNQFYRSLCTIHSRHIGDMPDMSRKEWLENFYDRHKKPFTHVIKDPIILESPFERMAIANNFVLEDIDEPSLQYTLLLQLREAYQQETQHFPNSLIRDYYNQLFDTVLQDAVTNNVSLSNMIFQRKQLAYGKKLKSINHNKYHNALNIPESYAQLFAANGRKYRHIEADSVYLSNETLLQGIVIHNRANDPYEEKTLGSHPRYYANFTALEFAHTELQARCGNIVGVYMNSNNENSLIDGMKIYLYCSEILKQELPIILYNEMSGKINVMDWDQFNNEFNLSFYITYSISENNEINFQVEIFNEEDEMKSSAELTPIKTSSTRPTTTPPTANKNVHFMSPLLLPGAVVNTFMGSTAPVIPAQQRQNLANLFSSPQVQSVLQNTSVSSSSSLHKRPLAQGSVSTPSLQSIPLPSSSAPTQLLVPAPTAKRVCAQQVGQTLPTSSAAPTVGLSFSFLSMQMPNNNSNSIFNSGVSSTFNLPPSFLNFLPKPQ